MSLSRLAKTILATLTAFSLFMPALPVAAAPTTATSNTDHVVGSATLRVMAGSVHDSVVVADGAMTIVVPQGEVAEVRTVGTAAVVENDAGLATCRVIRVPSELEPVNQMIIMGPRTVTLRPNGSLCSTSGVSEDNRSLFSFSVPTAGQTVKAGTTAQIFWALNGKAVSSIRLRLSTDGGASYPVTLSSGAINNGFHSWNIPSDTFSTAEARLKIEGYEGLNIVALAVSQMFTIDGVPAPAPTEPDGSITVEPYDYDPATETADAATISVDKRLGPNNAPMGTLSCLPDSRIKTKDSAAVYYCGRNGSRYVFPNQKTHDSWYSNFAGVIEITPEEMAQIPIGGNVTYRPGVKMLKLTTAPDVFAVAADGTLRYVTEAIAVRLYGPDWNKQIDDLPDTFFTDYVIGEPVKE